MNFFNNIMPKLHNAFAGVRRASVCLGSPPFRDGAEEMENTIVFRFCNQGFRFVVTVRFIDHDGIGELDNPFFHALQFVTGTG